jgi:putative phosphoribosyl transferase
LGIVRRKRKVAPAEPEGPVVLHRRVEVAVDPVRLPGDLATPAGAFGIVIFAHGSGSSRTSPRNVSVAGALNRAGLATLLFDLLTPAEAEDRASVFDVERQASRLVAATKWIGTWPDVGMLPVGYFGASTGAASALLAAARMPMDVSAVVSRGGRPDLAGEILERVTCPTLLIVGGEDAEVLGPNREAERRLHCEHRLDVVPGATHLFEEPGALERVTELATEWFAKHLGEAPRRERASLARTLSG